MSVRETTDPKETDRHNSWVEEKGYRWCEPCWRTTGIRRVMGWTPNWVYDETHQAAFEQKSGILTCPACRNTITVTTPGTVWDDPPDGFAERVAP